MSTPDSFGLDDVLERHARVRPQVLAAVCNGARTTWQQMHARCQALADELSAAGLGAGDRVLWWGQNCHRLLEVLFAVARLGAVVCPANWRQTSSELRFVLDDCCPAVVIWQVQEIGDIACTVRGRGGLNVFCRRVDATELCRLIDAEQCTHAFLQPPTLAQMMQANSD